MKRDTQITQLAPHAPGTSRAERAIVAQLWPIVVDHSRSVGITLSPLNRRHFCATVLPALRSYVLLWQQFETEALRMSANLRQECSDDLDERRQRLRGMVAEFGGRELFDALVSALRNR